MVNLPAMPFNSPVPEPGATTILHLDAARIHGRRVLQRKAAVFAVERAGNHLHSHVAGASLLGIAAREHLAFGRGFQIAVNLLVEGVAAEAFGRSGRKRLHVDRECAVRMVSHGDPLGLRLRERREQGECEADRG